eukprot:TRINITY_DN2414_c0_g3_i2.p2 TRINITY_DN2414_c0_g3~~TRINITY_DN2414_c0_g3_i2.p2  ORF type:complete len:300 (+),score=101.79 TRINITY_DN2414_c0_g3_i2:74-973(+)
MADLQAQQLQQQQLAAAAAAAQAQLLQQAGGQQLQQQLQQQQLAQQLQQQQLQQQLAAQQLQQQQQPHHQPGVNRPPDVVSVPGLTDRRFEGRVETFFNEKMFGFIRSEELRAGRFPDKDIFVHKRQLLHFQQGDFVSFCVSLNRQGKPQAMELGPPGATQGIDPNDPTYAMKAAAMQAQQQVMPAPQMPSTVPPQVPVAAPVLEPRQPLLPPLTAPAPLTIPQEEYGLEEVDMSLESADALKGIGPSSAQEIIKLVGGDISIHFVNQGPARIRAQIRGPKFSASLGACLMLQRVMAPL